MDYFFSRKHKIGSDIMGNHKFYNPKIIQDINVPDDARFMTSISLKKNTYYNIENIKKQQPQFYRTKGQVVDAAVAYFLKHLQEEKQVFTNG